MSPAADEKASVASIARAEALQPGGFPAWLREQVRTQQWANPTGLQFALDRETVERSLRASRTFLLKNQKPTGNFNYSYDFVEGRLQESDQQVRQAGTLWVLALLSQEQPDPEVCSAVDRALDFFLSHTRATGSNGALAVAYPNEAECQSGTVALAALAIMERLQARQPAAGNLTQERRQQLEAARDGYLRHIESMRFENQHFSSAWSWSKKKRSSSWDPYSDGECLLCFVKAAKYFGASRLVRQIEPCIAHLARHYTAGQWLRHPNSDRTKGFFQWGCMAFWEYRDTGWEEAKIANDYLLKMGWWLTHVSRVLNSPGNTAADFEGLIHCWLAAKEANDQPAARELAWTIDQGLRKLITWQVAGPLEGLNPFLRTHATTDPLAVGGVMGRTDDPVLRIDVTVHQLHALMLAREYLPR